MSKKGLKDGVTSHYGKYAEAAASHPPSWRAFPLPLECEITTNTTRGKKKDNAYFSAFILRARNVNFTNKQPPPPPDSAAERLGH